MVSEEEDVNLNLTLTASSLPPSTACTPVKSPDDIISEKSAKIKEWAKQRLQYLEDQNARLREQNRRCTDQLKALTSCAERNRHLRNSILLSQSVTGALPHHRDMLDAHRSRTSDDSGLTSDETSGDSRKIVPPSTLPLKTFYGPGGKTAPPTSSGDNSNSPPGTGVVSMPALMTQSTSALMKRSPRHLRRAGGTGMPRTTLAQGPSVKKTPADPTTPSTSDSSPWEPEQPAGGVLEVAALAPVPAPRRLKPAPVSEKFDNDSLNSYAGEDDYGEFEDDDEVEEEDDDSFEKIVDSPCCRTADYVNLADFCVVKEGPAANGKTRPPSEGLGLQHEYSPIIKAVPELPKHQPLVQFEEQLFRTAEKCLSIVADSPVPSTSGEGGFGTPRRSGANAESSRHPSSVGSFRSRESQPDSGLGRVSSEHPPPRPPDCMVLTHPPHDSPRVPSSSMSNGDYATPPDVATLSRRSGPRPVIVRASVVPQNDAELAGYLTAMSDNRLRSLKRRYVVLRSAELRFYRTQKHFYRDEPPTMVVPLREVQSVVRATSKCSAHGLEISTGSDKLRYHGESEKSSEEWIYTLHQALRSLTINDIAQNGRPTEPTVSGWLTRVKHGHAKRYYAQLAGDKLLFFKAVDEKLPHSHQALRGARVSEKVKSASSDEYSASSGDEAPVQGACRGSGGSSSLGQNGATTEGEFSICIEVVDSDPQYLILKNSDDKDRWLYYLRLAAKDAAISGTSFEILVQRLMAEREPLSSPLWQDVLISTVEEQQTSTLTSIDEPEISRKALEIDLACYLFASVQMKPIAIQYHVDLAQNVLSSALEHPALQNEIYAQLIRLTTADMPHVYQAWKLIAMAIPLYLPKQYSLLWLLRNHVQRIRESTTSPYAKFADYCFQAMSNRQQVGDRLEGPSKLEALSILTRDPTDTALPHSIAVRLPTGEHQVIEFDGSTEIGQCLSSLCLKLGLRPALLSGYAMYANDPAGAEEDVVLLRGRQKICDCLTVWERQAQDGHCGRVTTNACSIRLQLRLRNYWPSLADDETPNERLFLCYRMSEEVSAGHLPLSNDLAEELCALYAQLCFGDPSGVLGDDVIDEVLAKFYPRRLLEATNRKLVRHAVVQHWTTHLRGVGVAECVRLILAVLRKWKFFGAYIGEARQKMAADKRVYIAFNESGVHILSDQLEATRSFPFHQLINFGDYNGDFMLTVSRILPPNAHPEEATRERLTFNAGKKTIEQLTIHLAEYIRCQKLLWKMSCK